MPNQLSHHGQLTIARESADLYIRWITRARPGWRAMYHYGDVAVDRETSMTTTMVANVMAAAYMHGLVLLCRERVEGERGMFRYYAYRTAVPMNAKRAKSLISQTRGPDAGQANSPGATPPGSARPFAGRILPPLPATKHERSRRNAAKAAERAQQLGAELLTQLQTERAHT